MNKNNEKISKLDKKMAKLCLSCPVCNHAREKKKGITYNFVRVVENKICPFCKAYEKVYNKKAHQ